MGREGIRKSVMLRKDGNGYYKEINNSKKNVFG